MRELFADVDTNDPTAVLARALRVHHPRLAIASSFSQEDVLLIGLAREIEPKVRVFSLDTGRLPEATYRYAATLAERWSLEIEWVFPDHTRVEAILRTDGLWGFRQGLEARHRCCDARKLEPAGRVLAGVDVWVTGQRRAQAVTRTELEVVEARPGQPLKLNPLAHWSFDAVEEALRRRAWPRHPLYEQGFRSIGCAPCTRAVGPHEDERAGRWWWESAEHKECGLHDRPQVTEETRR